MVNTDSYIKTDCSKWYIRMNEKLQKELEFAKLTIETQRKANYALEQKNEELIHILEKRTEDLSSVLLDRDELSDKFEKLKLQSYYKYVVIWNKEFGHGRRIE